MDTPTPNFPTEDDFVERATQGITEDSDLSAEVSPTSHATQQPLTPYNVVTSGSTPVVRYPYSGTRSLRSLQSTAVSLSSSSPTLPHQPTVVLAQSVAQSSSDNHESTLITVDAHRAGEAFKRHRGDLLIAVTDPLILANSLYSRSIVSRETLSRVQLPALTNSEKNVILFDAIEDRIRTHPSDFRTLLAILDCDSHLRIFAEGIRNSYCKYHA